MFVKNKRANKKAQVSVEYALVIGLIIFALTLAVGIAFFYSTTAKHQITINQIDKIGKKIAETADSIYYLGSPSKATIDINMPEGVKAIEIIDSSMPTDNIGDFIKFTYTGSTGTSYAMYYTKAGLYMIDQQNGLNHPRFISPGFKHLVVEVTNVDDRPVIKFTPQFA